MYHNTKIVQQYNNSTRHAHNYITPHETKPSDAGSKFYDVWPDNIKEVYQFKFIKK